MRDDEMAGVRLGAAMRQIHLLFGEGTLAGLPDAQILERYVTQRDELAFTALVQRHGPMVLAVCRGVLEDPNDADDAFQAAFLLLARKAKSLWVDDSLGGWLHRVASRIAFQMKSDTARRRDQERRAAEKAGVRSDPGKPEVDTYRVLHQEIDRLPERYRKPIVLCYLEQMTYQQAASHLRWSEGTTQGRLARATEFVASPIGTAGVTLGAATLGALALPREASAVSVTMLLSTVRTARFFGLGETAGVGTVSTAAEILVKQALRTMIMAKLKMVAAAGIFLGGLTCVATGLTASGPMRAEEPAVAASRIDPAPLAPEPTTSPDPADMKTMLAYRDTLPGREKAPEPEDAAAPDRDAREGGQRTVRRLHELFQRAQGRDAAQARRQSVLAVGWLPAPHAEGWKPRPVPHRRSADARRTECPEPHSASLGLLQHSHLGVRHEPSQGGRRVELLL